MTPRPNRTSLVLAAVALAGILTNPVATAVPAKTGGTARPGPCAWSFVMNPTTSNVLWPDLNATYWTTPYVLLPGSELVVRGTYPESRYMSIQTYGLGPNVDGLRDDQITADTGSANPFVDPSAPTDPAERRYTVRVRPSTTPTPGDNEIAAFADGAGAGFGFLAYRVYVSDVAADPKGTVPLPEVALRLFGGRLELPMPTCPWVGGTAAAPQAQTRADTLGHLGTSISPATEASATSTPVTMRLNDAASFFPNLDVEYLSAAVQYKRGQVVVLRGKAPTFPDTRAGEHVTTPHELRYWSLCVDEFRPPLPAAGCAADFETVLDADGWYTYVISTPQDRPANASSDANVTWLPWGTVGVDDLLVLRNMIPSADFHNAVQDVPAPGQEQAAMGEYYPQGATCDRSVFESGGAAACLGTS